MNDIFESPGKKLKATALILFILSLIACFVIFFMTVVNEEDILLVLAYTFGCGFGGWVTSLMLYAFGELVENSANPQKYGPTVLSPATSLDMPTAPGGMRDARHQELLDLKNRGLISEAEFFQLLSKGN